MGNSTTNKIRVDGKVYYLEDTQAREDLGKEVYRATEKEIALETTLNSVKSKTESSLQKLNTLNGTGEGSIKKQVEDIIAKTSKTNPEVFEAIQSLGTWMENDETGAASLSMQVNTNKEDIKTLLESKIYLTQEEYENLLENGLVLDEVEYNIYEDSEE